MLLKLVSCSNVYAAFKIVSSENLFPINCIPIGIPLLFTPHGIDIPGSPAIFTDTVQISAKYISSGLLDFVPISKATFGAVGVSSKSYFSKALLNYFVTKVRTCCAFL